MSIGPGPCLTDTEMLGFLEGTLAEARRATVERHLDECRLCEASVEGVAGLEWREDFLRSAESLRARVRARTEKAMKTASATARLAPRLWPARRYLALAATLVLGVGVAVVLTRPSPGESLFRQHFEPYPSTRPLVRGMSAEHGSGGDTAGEDNTSDALALYQARDYRGALAGLERSLERTPRDPAAVFYAGLSRLALGHTREAIRDLELVGRLGASEFRAPAEWYLALARLRTDDLAAARSQLERVAEVGGFYRDEARALLSELNRLERGR